jgi:hypothetical protein
MTHFTESTIKETALEGFKDLEYSTVFVNNIVHKNKLVSLQDRLFLKVARYGLSTKDWRKNEPAA